MAHATAVLLSGSVLPGTNVSQLDHRLVTPSAMGPVRLGMTLDEARRALPDVSFARTTDGDGAALVLATFGKDDKLTLWAEEEDPDASIDWSRQVTTIYTYSGTFHTADGIRPGSLVTDVETLYGPVAEIVKSEIESREFITFERQPDWLTLRLDYTGDFTTHPSRTTRFRPGAKIYALQISSH